MEAKNWIHWKGKKRKLSWRQKINKDLRTLMSTQKNQTSPNQNARGGKKLNTKRQKNWKERSWRQKINIKANQTSPQNYARGGKIIITPEEQRTLVEAKEQNSLLKDILLGVSSGDDEGIIKKIVFDRGLSMLSVESRKVHINSILTQTFCIIKTVYS